MGPVLVVEDDPSLLESLSWILEDEGLAVVTASDGRRAVEQAVAHQPAVVVLDMGLPLLSGDEVALELQQRLHPMPPVVVMSADGRAAARAQRIGAVAYFHKPFDLDDMVDAIRQAIEQSGQAD